MISRKPKSQKSQRLKAILHIGTHKTGSTFLQNWLVRNREPLAREGLIVPRNIQGGHRFALAVPREGNSLIGQVADRGTWPELDDVLSEMRASANAVDNPVLVISSEFFWDLPAKKIVDLFDGMEMDIIKVICFLRRQDALEASNHAQGIKRLGWCSEYQPRGNPKYLDWHSLYESWVAALDRKRIRMHYYGHHARQKTLLDVFKKEIGCVAELPGERIPGNGMENFSLGAESTEIARLANMIGWPEVSYLLSAFPETAAGKCRFALSPADVTKIEHQYRPSNERLVRELKRKEFAELTLSDWTLEGADLTGRMTPEILFDVMHRLQCEMNDGGYLQRNDALASTGDIYASITEKARALGKDVDLLAAYASCVDAKQAAIEEATDLPPDASVPGELFAALRLLRRVASAWSDGPRRKSWFELNARAEREKRVAAFQEEILGRTAGPKPLGHRMISRLIGGFDETFYLSNYPDVAVQGSDALRHYLLFGWREGRRKSPPRERALLRKAAVALIGGFDADYYLKTHEDLSRSGIDPLAHYLKFGWREGRSKKPPIPAVSTGDERNRSASRNPFLNCAKVVSRLESGSTLEKPVTDGRRSREARRAARWLAPALLRMSGAWQELDQGKDTILVVLHEGTRTGAPIIGYDLVLSALSRYNVVVLVLQPGPIANACRAAGAVVLTWRRSRCRSWFQGSAVTSWIAGKVRLKAALINSVEARFVLPGLVCSDVPTVGLVHEFASYIRPHVDFSSAVKLSHHTVFPSEVVRRDALALHPELATRSLSVTSQGLCAVPYETDTSAEDRQSVRQMLGLDGVSKDTIVIIGAAFVSYRKGLDLFVQTASRMLRSCPDGKYHFVWIGGGYRPNLDQGYSAFIADQIARESLEGRVHFSGEVQNMEEVYRQSDLILLTSRLDPMPNVAIEAMWHGVPVMCFRDASGTARLPHGSGSRRCVRGRLPERGGSCFPNRSACNEHALAAQHISKAQEKCAT
ncbi:MAG: glycosyltransferase family 4 protein [Nitratireductor sp.]